MRMFTYLRRYAEGGSKQLFSWSTPLTPWCRPGLRAMQWQRIPVDTALFVNAVPNSGAQNADSAHGCGADRARYTNEAPKPSPQWHDVPMR